MTESSEIREISVVIGDQEYSKPWDPQCPACISPLMRLIDEMTAHGWAYPRIADSLKSSYGASFSAAQLRAHLAHLTSHQQEERRVLDEAAAARAGAPDVASLVSAQDLVRLSLQRAYERVSDGAEVNLRDITALLRLQQQTERDGQADEAAATVLQWEAAFRELMWLLRRHLRGPAWGAFMADLKASESLNALMPRPGNPKESPGEPAAG